MLSTIYAPNKIIFFLLTLSEIFSIIGANKNIASVSIAKKVVISLLNHPASKKIKEKKGTIIPIAIW